jgi:hypothetical protein
MKKLIITLTSLSALVACGGTLHPGAGSEDGGAGQDAAVDGGAAFMEGGAVDGGALRDAGADVERPADGAVILDGDACAPSNLSEVLCYGSTGTGKGTAYAGACPQPEPSCRLVTHVANPPVWCCDAQSDGGDAGDATVCVDPYAANAAVDFCDCRFLATGTCSVLGFSCGVTFPCQMPYRFDALSCQRNYRDGGTAGCVLHDDGVTWCCD